jgi:hypothetical protein
MKQLTRMAAIAAIASALMGCAVYAPAPVAYAPGPAYYGAPVVVGVYHGGWHGGYHGGWHHWG